MLLERDNCVCYCRGITLHVLLERDNCVRYQRVITVC